MSNWSKCVCNPMEMAISQYGRLSMTLLDISTSRDTVPTNMVPMTETHLKLSRIKGAM